MFVKGRSIADGIRTVLDLLDYTEKNNVEGLIMTIDFEKAFDSLSWKYLFKAIESFSFGSDVLT